MPSAPEPYKKERLRDLTPLFFGFVVAVALAVAVSWEVLSLAVGRNTKGAATTGALGVMIGATQAAYIVPLYFSLRRRYSYFSTGLVRGAIIVFVANAAFLAFVWSLPQLK
jgi:hypothetical protein